MAAGGRSVSFSAGGVGVMGGMKVHTAAGGGLSQRFSLELTLNKRQADTIGKST